MAAALHGVARLLAGGHAAHDTKDVHLIRRALSAIGGADLRGLIAFSLATTGIQAIRPTASYRVLELGGSATVVGLIAAGYGALSLFAAVPLGRAIDRRGASRFLLAGLILLCAAGIISAIATEAVVLGVGQVVLGLAHVMAAIAFQTITANRRHSNRDRGFARLAVAISIGQLIGPLLGGFVLDAPSMGPLDALPRTVSVFLLAATLIAIAATTAFRIDDGSSSPRATKPAGDRSSGSSAQPTGGSRPLTIIRRGGVVPALGVGMVVATTIDLLISFLPVIGESRGIAPSIVGTLLAVRASAGLLSRLSLTALLARFTRRQVLVTILGTAGTALVGIAWSGNPWVLGLSVAVVGFCLGLGSPMTMAWLSISTPRPDRGTVLAIRMTGNRIMQVSMPVAAGALTTLAGPGAIFGILTFVLVPASLLLARSSVEIP